jgi:hypothetical protein
MLYAEIELTSDDANDEPRVFRACGVSVTIYAGETKTLRFPVSGNGEGVVVETLTLTGEIVETAVLTVTVPQ